WDELKAEEPLLLHPYFDRCEDHFKAGIDGVIWGTTPQGRATVQTCDLNRPKLRTARARAEEDIRMRAAFVCNQLVNDKPITDLLVDPKEQFSVYRAHCLIKYVEGMIREAKGKKVRLRR
ncbi:MAG TPA: hypothetical protein VFB30_15250, partial [Spirochaetia bacterium]|nr:hypothetical protein [Spirochaetia bacterium]